MSNISSAIGPIPPQSSEPEPPAPQFDNGARVLFHTTHNNGAPCTLAGRIDSVRPARIGGTDTWRYTFTDERSGDRVTAYQHWLKPDPSDLHAPVALLTPPAGVYTPAPTEGRRAGDAR